MPLLVALAADEEPFALPLLRFWLVLVLVYLN